MSCGVLTSGGVLKDENGLILPRKITNPCLESLPVREIHREIRWNTDKGINVLNNKSELEKAFAKYRKTSEQKNQETGKEFEDEFKKMLEERARKLEQMEVEDRISEQNLSQLQKVQLKKHSQPQNKPDVISESKKSVIEQKSEFERVFTQLRGEKRELVF